MQIDVDNYLLSAISECCVSKDGYYLLPPMAGFVHLLLHTMVHLNNPVEHVTIKNLLDVAYYLLFHKTELDPKLCGVTMRKLNLEKAFDLFLQASEWILSVDFSHYREQLKSESEDFENLVTLLLNDSLRCPQFDNHSYVKQLTQQISYYNKTKWRFSYLPNWKTLNKGFMKSQLVLFAKALLKKPFDEPLCHPAKN